MQEITDLRFMKIFLISLFLFTLGCTEKDSSSDQRALNTDNEEADISQHYVFWSSFDLNDSFAMVGGMVDADCTDLKCEVDVVVFQMYSNQAYFRNFSYSGTLYYNSSTGRYSGNLNYLISNNPVNTLEMDLNGPIRMYNSTKCLIFGNNSNSRADYDTMKSGLVGFSDNNFYSVGYGYSISSPECNI